MVRHSGMTGGRKRRRSGGGMAATGRRARLELRGSPEAQAELLRLCLVEQAGDFRFPVAAATGRQAANLRNLCLWAGRAILIDHEIPREMMPGLFGVDRRTVDRLVEEVGDSGLSVGALVSAKLFRGMRDGTYAGLPGVGPAREAKWLFQLIQRSLPDLDGDWESAGVPDLAELRREAARFLLDWPEWLAKEG